MTGPRGRWEQNALRWLALQAGISQAQEPTNGDSRR
jgi:hypothetical protein